VTLLDGDSYNGSTVVTLTNGGGTGAGEVCSALTSVVSNMSTEVQIQLASGGVFIEICDDWTISFLFVKLGAPVALYLVLDSFDCCSTDQTIALSPESGTDTSGYTIWPTEVRIQSSGCCADCPIDWAQVAVDNGNSLFVSLPCDNTPDPLELVYSSGRFRATGAWGLCADDFNDIRLDCDSETGAQDPLTGVPQLTGNHGGAPFRVPIIIVSFDPFYAYFTEKPFDGSDTNSNEPCGGCVGPFGEALTGTIEP
jgi:hypothetical protein